MDETHIDTLRQRIAALREQLRQAVAQLRAARPEHAAPPYQQRIHDAHKRRKRAPGFTGKW